MRGHKKSIGATFVKSVRPMEDEPLPYAHRLDPALRAALHALNAERIRTDYLSPCQTDPRLWDRPNDRAESGCLDCQVFALCLNVRRADNPKRPAITGVLAGESIVEPRGAVSDKTLCRSGLHFRTEENLVVSSNGYLICRPCKRESEVRAQAKRVARRREQREQEDAA